MLTAKSLPFSLALDDRDVSVDRQIGKPFHRTARKRPLHFHPIELLALPNAKHNPRVMRRQVAPAVHLHAAALEISRVVSNPRTDRVSVCFFSDQRHTKSVILPSKMLAEKHRR